MDRDIPNTNEIKMFIHCGLCVDEWKAKVAGIMSPREYASLECGWTPLGIQIWCKRHEKNVVHMDFQGYKHPANLSRLP